MRAKVRRWGNSLAIRIPRSFAQEVGLMAGSSVELHVTDGALVVEPARAPTLEELLAGVTQDNLHEAIDVGPPEGNEVW